MSAWFKIRLHVQPTAGMVLLLILATTVVGVEPLWWADTIKAMPRHPAALKCSDVSMRALKKVGSDEVIEAGRRFHITRLDWCYATDRTWIAKLQAEGWTFMGAIVNNGRKDRSNWRYRADGQYYVPRWFVWNDKQNPLHSLPCYNNPLTYDDFVRSGKTYLDMGLRSLHKDDTEGNAANHSIKGGACHCRHCLAKASKQGVDLTRSGQMKRFQQQSVSTFYRRARKAFEDHCGEPIALCGNIHLDHPIASTFDFAIREVQAKQVQSPAWLRASVGAARHQGKVQAYVAQHDWGRQGFRRGIAMVYAAGANLIVPWDNFLLGERGRLFAEPAELADLYGFVRGIAPWLDGYEDAGAAGAGVRKASDLLSLTASPHCTAWVRVKPGNRRAPIVVHLTATSDQAASAVGKIKIRKSACFGGAPVSIQLCRPVAYHADLHARVAQSGNYALLRTLTSPAIRTEGDMLHIDVPPLDPWAVLVIHAQSNGSAGDKP